MMRCHEDLHNERIFLHVSDDAATNIYPLNRLLTLQLKTHFPSLVVIAAATISRLIDKLINRKLTCHY